MKRLSTIWFLSSFLSIVLCLSYVQNVHCAFGASTVDGGFRSFYEVDNGADEFYMYLAQAMEEDSVESLRNAIDRMGNVADKVRYKVSWSPSERRMSCCARTKDGLIFCCPIAVGTGFMFASGGLGLLATLTGKVISTAGGVIASGLCYCGLQKPLGGQSPSRHYDEVAVFSGEFSLLTIAVMNGAHQCVKYLFKEGGLTTENESFSYRNWLPRLDPDTNLPNTSWKSERNFLNSCCGFPFSCEKCHDVLEKEDEGMGLDKTVAGRGHWRWCSCGHEWEYEEPKQEYEITPLFAALLFSQASAERKCVDPVGQMIRIVGIMTLDSNPELITRPSITPKHLISSESCCHCVASCCEEACKDGVLCCFKCCSYNGRNDESTVCTPLEFANKHFELQESKQNAVDFIQWLEKEGRRRIAEKRQRLENEWQDRTTAKKKRKREKKRKNKRARRGATTKKYNETAGKTIILLDGKDVPSTLINADAVRWSYSDFEQGSAGASGEYSYYSYSGGRKAASDGSCELEVVKDEAEAEARPAEGQKMGSISADTHLSEQSQGDEYSYYSDQMSRSDEKQDKKSKAASRSHISLDSNS